MGVAEAGGEAGGEGLLGAGLHGLLARALDLLRGSLCHICEGQGRLLARGRTAHLLGSSPQSLLPVPLGLRHPCRLLRSLAPHLHLLHGSVVDRREHDPGALDSVRSCSRYGDVGVHRARDEREAARAARGISGHSHHAGLEEFVPAHDVVHVHVGHLQEVLKGATDHGGASIAADKAEEKRIEHRRHLLVLGVVARSRANRHRQHRQDIHHVLDRDHIAAHGYSHNFILTKTHRHRLVFVKIAVHVTVSADDDLGGLVVEHVRRRQAVGASDSVHHRGKRAELHPHHARHVALVAVFAVIVAHASKAHRVAYTVVNHVLEATRVANFLAEQLVLTRGPAEGLEHRYCAGDRSTNNESLGFGIERHALWVPVSKHLPASKESVLCAQHGVASD
mmetsp:Transcript_42861/g.65821  ORF Transcript_42861/g.65821 Transcript_42861/m.65821 type:complete len:393 (-) Transcript_42861:1661-2839(-)